MPTRRQRRINELLLQELSMTLPGRVDDPRLSPVVITRVESTQDLASAKVFFTTSSAVDEGAEADIHAGLEQARGFLHGELSALGLRRVPRLVFARDRDYESGARVLDLLGQITADQQDQGTEASETDLEPTEQEGSVASTEDRAD